MEYTTLKVPDLRKLLQERSLPVTGNKADLISRLQENDKEAAPAAAAAQPGKHSQLFSSCCSSPPELLAPMTPMNMDATGDFSVLELRCARAFLSFELVARCWPMTASRLPSDGLRVVNAVEGLHLLSLRHSRRIWSFPGNYYALFSSKIPDT